MCAAIAEIMADVDHELSFSRRSRAGRHCSLLLAVTVESEDQRNAIFTALQQHRDIRIVASATVPMNVTVASMQIVLSARGTYRRLSVATVLLHADLAR